MNSTGNTNNDARKGLTNSLQSFDKESVDFPGSIRYYINNGGAMNAPTVSKGHYIMAKSVIVVTDSLNSAPEVFSSIDPALAYVRDLAGDMNPEGSALMLAGAPATVKAVKASCRRTLDFTVSGADAASQVAAAQSKLDGAIAACALVGVDPDNVAKVAELRAAVDSAQLLAADASADSVELSITAMVLHKRGYNK